MRIFVKLSCSLVIHPERFTLSSDKSNRKRNIDSFFVDTVHKFIYHPLCKIQQVLCQVILFQIKLNARNIKETKLAKHFIKVTAHSSFTRLRGIKRINRVH